MCRACYEKYGDESDDDAHDPFFEDDKLEEDEDEVSEDNEPLPRQRGSLLKEPLQIDICHGIDCISQDTKGEWASSGPLSGPFADPILVVDEAGPIGFPLNEVDAQRIIAASHQAPFGKKEQTIVDTDVRRTWELNASDFTIGNRSFRQLVRNTVRTATAELGIASSVEVRADVYKTLLYEKGAMFKPHVE